MDLPDVGNMSSTHSANPLSCSAGLAVIEEIRSKKLVDQSMKNGILFSEALKKLKNKFPNNIASILGKGMIQAIIFKNPLSGDPDAEFASCVAERCMQKGLLVVHTGRESIKLGPPLTIPEDALMEGVTVIEESIEEVINK